MLQSLPDHIANLSSCSSLRLKAGLGLIADSPGLQPADPIQEASGFLLLGNTERDQPCQEM